MRIVIVGAGAVGSYLAERLSAEGQDVVVLESDAKRVRDLQQSLDALVLHGNGASPKVLEEAGIDDTDLLIAVTSSDAANVLACHAAARADVPTKVARVEDATLREELEGLGVDVIIDPGEALAREVVALASRGGVSEVNEFAAGRLVLLGGYMSAEAPTHGMPLSELRKLVTAWDWIIVAIVRDGETIIARGDLTLEEGDHVLVMAKANGTDEALELLGLELRQAHRAFVLGATRSARLTAVELAKHDVDTTLVDADPERCRAIAASTDGVVVVNGDPTDPDVLRAEGIDHADVVAALSGWDEVNVLGCLVCKALGARFAMARFHDLDLVALLAGHGIDAGVSSRLAAANEILRFVRRGDIRSVVTFQDTEAEAIELQVTDHSPAVGKALTDVKLPKSVIIGGVLRNSDVFVPHGSTVIEAHDHLIMFALPEAFSKIEKLFS